MNMTFRKGPRRGQNNENRRLFGIFLLLMFCFSSLFIRLFFLQIVSGETLRERYERQGRFSSELLPWRGTIYDRNRRELAISVSTDSVYLRPRSVAEPEEVAEELRSVLHVGKEEIESKLYSESPFVWIRRKVERADSARLRMLPGLGMVEESRRFYPYDSLASHIIGFAGMDNYGLEGIELLYDRYLGGVPGALSSRRDARGRETAALRRSRVNPDEGNSLLLTIDKMIQLIVEEEIDKTFTSGASSDCGLIGVSGVSVIVMEPRTGEILALANRPSFSPLQPGLFSPEERRNRAVTDLFEPGSSFKVVAAAGALEEGIFACDDEIFCEDGAYRVAGVHTVRDVSPSGWLTFSEIMEKSSNIGILKIGRALGNENLYRYVKEFGFGEKTGCDLPGEASGVIRHPRTWSALSNSSICFGYEVAVTPMQLAAAYSAIANGGLLMRPMLVRAIVDSEGRPVEVFEPEARRRVVSAETSRILTEMLERAVERGTGQRAKIRGYRIAGKTGTAKKLEETGAYSDTKYVSSFVGIAPAFSESGVVVLVVVDEPDAPPRQCYGGAMAAPLFQRISSRVLHYLDILPDDAPARMVESGNAGSAGGNPGGSGGREEPGFSGAGPAYVLASRDEDEHRLLMPDVRGMNMREALRKISPLGLRVNFSGSGVALRQRPMPGEEIKIGSECFIVFGTR